ncbi:hypothetical protein [Larkinella humicola]|uniref:Uncharacterized protein n=1 Tax=Larkinella humicola TaxID=2607654 RepID=A0A5N1JA70_9BACT|nr:hypothetical protein [Larkinella humicola]KAA9349572.1 hypothetical protein F0P93_19095 [Larkinella humicola]
MQNDLSKNEFGRLSNGQFTFGNKFSRYTEEEREEQFQTYLIHRSYGKPKEEFILCSYRDLEKWADSSADKKEELEMAERKGQAYWSGVLVRAALGLEVPYNDPITGKLTVLKPEKVNTTLLIFYLKALYPKTYRDNLKESNREAEKTVPESVPFTIIQNNIIEEFTLLGAALTSFKPDLNKNK